MLGHTDFVLVSGRRDERVGAIAELQRGRVARWQLLSAGTTDNMIHSMLAPGTLRPRLPGVYAIGLDTVAELTRETEALLASPRGTLHSHQSAAALWTLIAPRRATDPIDVTVQRLQTLHIPGVRSHRTSTLDGMTPTPARTADSRPSPPPARSSRSPPT